LESNESLEERPEEEEEEEEEANEDEYDGRSEKPFSDKSKGLLSSFDDATLVASDDGFILFPSLLTLLLLFKLKSSGVPSSVSLVSFFDLDNLSTFVDF
jgi:hypothetical protein